jgi:hypothetical protein
VKNFFKFLTRVGIVLGLILTVNTIYNLVAAHRKQKADEDQKTNAYVHLYEQANFKGEPIRFHFGDDNANFHDVATHDFDDKAVCAKWNIPSGWQVVLYDDNSYKGEKFVMSGSNNCPDLKKTVKASSLCWKKIPN